MTKLERQRIVSGMDPRICRGGPHAGYRIHDIEWLGLSASVLAGEGFPQPGPERPK